jgi:hypothetical protein
MFPGFAETAAAFAIMLSAIVRQIRSGSVWYAIDEGQTTTEHLRELTGIREYDRLQEAFGPPRMDGVWPVTRAEVKANRTGLGYLMGDRWFDGASILIAIVALMPVWPMWTAGAVLQMLLAFAGAYQIMGWLAATSLFGRR